MPLLFSAVFSVPRIIVVIFILPVTLFSAVCVSARVGNDKSSLIVRASCSVCLVNAAVTLPVVVCVFWRILFDICVDISAFPSTVAVSDTLSFLPDDTYVTSFVVVPVAVDILVLLTAVGVDSDVEIICD